MNSKKFSEAMNEIDDKYVDEAIQYKKKKPQKPIWIKWGAMAACLCLVIIGGVMFTQNNNNIAPNPDFVQVPNPIITVSSVSEMEEYLDFEVPTLDKEIEAYEVLVVDSYPTMGQVRYTDGSEFRILYGSEDISGIHGGSLVETKNIDDIEVKYYEYTDTTYAIWEQKGFSFSYVYTTDGTAEVETFIQQFK
ncbi:hypothetical protein [Youxingia wuxianensis]|uniref:hypothetical protein n=1 Tax=Youxingia wuxianensis TaxID=2763678 RepID=UPI0021CCEC46|nr:hypothetical protein [Youxingia wuxianensis]